MNKRPTLEDFIKTYLNNLKIESDAKIDRVDYMNSNQNDARGSFSDESNAANIAFIKANSTYGERAEKLSNSGLDFSGYAAYINKYAEEKRKESINSALNKVLGTEQKNREGYLNYVEKINAERAKENQSKINKITSALKGTGILNYEDAYNYAISEGLDEDIADAAAKNAVAENTRKARQNIVKTILSKRLSAEETFVYATALGLEESAAAELAEYAKKINESFNPTTGTYADYIKNLAKK